MSEARQPDLWRLARLAAMAAATLATSNCTSSGDDFIEVADAEVVVERRIDGDSPFWGVAPYLFEGPFTCPIPREATELGISQAHESFRIQNTGTAASLEIQIEGRSFDSTLSAEPLLLVYTGAEVPEQPEAVANCLGLAKPGGGAAGSVTISLAAGAIVTAIALEPEIGPGFDGSGSGRFRLRVSPQ